MGDGPVAQEVSNEQLVEAVAVVCRERGLPVAPTKYVAKVDGITVQQQTVKRRLERLGTRVASLQIGRGKVWWIPEDQEVAGEHKLSSIAWDNIDPSEIPLELIEEHPELHVPTYWERWEEKSGTLFKSALALTLPGFVVFALKDAQLPLISISDDVATLGALAAVAGIFIGVIAMVLMVASRIGISMSSRGLDEAILDVRDRFLTACRSRIPVSISITWKTDRD